jgi:hypothetical protein
MGRRRSGNYWLLINQRDAEARPSSGDAVVAHNLTSVATGRDIETIAAARDRLWRGARKAPFADHHCPPFVAAGAERPSVAARDQPNFADSSTLNGLSV